MNEPTSVFVSSVIKGYEEVRTSAKTAIESLSMKAIMAEEIEAKPETPRYVCLNGVEQASIFLLIIGQRYGFITDSGISVTEEEYSHARRHSKPIIVMVQSCERENKQEKFCRQVLSYQNGAFVNYFDSPSDLLLKIVKALDSLRRSVVVNTLSQGNAQKAMRDVAMSEKNIFEKNTAFGIITSTKKENQNLIDPIWFEQDNNKENIAQKLLFGKPTFFEKSLSTNECSQESSFRIIQTGFRDRPKRFCEFYMSGILSCTEITDSDNNSGSLINMYVVDERLIGKIINSCLPFVYWFYSELLSNLNITEIYLICVLHNFGNKKIGRIQDVKRNSFCLDFTEATAIMWVPQSPMLLNLRELGNPNILCKRLLDLIIRDFKIKERYWSE
ncbi:MAG: DUF4062 domain-containing protein [Sedimentisphaerales bacterium]|nr:DUF4062 domain-containing protein [Sedimentisphaerales bacterium]